MTLRSSQKDKGLILSYIESSSNLFKKLYNNKLNYSIYIIFFGQLNYSKIYYRLLNLLQTFEFIMPYF